jgi:hypothetical protein
MEVYCVKCKRLAEAVQKRRDWWFCRYCKIEVMKGFYVPYMRWEQ